MFHRHYCVDDGRYNNNGWLQELPEPITKVAWDNLILLSPKTFEKLGLVNQTNGGGTTQASLVKVVLDGREVMGPAWLQPGMADDTIGLALGYGRERSGRVGSGAGYDAYRLRATAAAALCVRGDADARWASFTRSPPSSIIGRWKAGRIGARGQSRTVLRAPGLREGHEAGAAADHPAALPESLRPGEERRGCTSGAWPLTSIPVSAVPRACWPARARTTFPSSARTR